MAEDCIYIDHLQDNLDSSKTIDIMGVLYSDHSSIKSISSYFYTLEPLPAQCVDTGMGLERITTVLNHSQSVYQSDLFSKVIERIHEIFGTDKKENVDWDQARKSTRIIADHLRTATHMISDGVTPKNVDQGYILRRLIRRAIREAYKMGYEKSFTA